MNEYVRASENCFKLFSMLPSSQKKVPQWLAVWGVVISILVAGQPARAGIEDACTPKVATTIYLKPRPGSPMIHLPEGTTLMETGVVGGWVRVSVGPVTGYMLRTIFLRLCSGSSDDALETLPLETVPAPTVAPMAALPDPPKQEVVVHRALNKPLAIALWATAGASLAAWGVTYGLSISRNSTLDADTRAYNAQPTRTVAQQQMLRDRGASIHRLTTAAWILGSTAVVAGAVGCILWETAPQPDEPLALRARVGVTPTGVWVWGNY